MKPKNNYRLTKQELILRSFAFTDGFEGYKGHLAKFLNEYMHKHRNASTSDLERLRERFVRVVSVVLKDVFGGDAPSRVSMTLLEALLVGVGRNLTNAAGLQGMSDRFARLKADPNFSEESLTEGLSKRQRVIDRLTRAVAIMGGQA